jgi:hypothetical protein
MFSGLTRSTKSTRALIDMPAGFVDASSHFMSRRRRLTPLPNPLSQGGREPDERALLTSRELATIPHRFATFSRSAALWR